MSMTRYVMKVVNIPKVKRLKQDHDNVVERYRRELSYAIHNGAMEKTIDDIDSVYLSTIFQLNHEIAELS